MTQQELYVNGQLVDLPDSVAVHLEYVSNIFGDLTKIEGGHSYTVALPKTANNIRIFDDPVSPAHESGTRGRYFDAVYYRKGINLTGNGKATVLAVKKDAIEIALLFFGMQRFSDFVAGNYSIRNFFTDDVTLRWEKQITPYDRMRLTGEGMAMTNTGISLAYFPKLFYPPAISLRRVFDRVMDSALGTNGYVVPAGVLESMNDLFLPFVDIIGAPTEEVRWDRFTFSNVYGTGYRKVLSLYNPDIDVDRPWGDFPWFTGQSVIVTEGLDTLKVRIEAVFPQTSFTSKTATLYVMGVKDGGSVFIDSEPLTFSGGLGEINYSRTLDIAEFSSLWFEVSEVGTGRYYSTIGDFYATVIGKRGKAGDRLIIGRNLPDIPAVDIVKFVCTFFGLALMPQDDKVAFVPYDEIAGREGESLDWSDKLVGYDLDDEISEEFFDIDGFAQHNLIKWADDGRLPVRIEQGDIVMDNEQLPAERTIAELPFAASYRSTYPIFSNGDAEAQTFDVNDVKPRIFKLITDTDGYTTLFFASDLALPSRVATYYKAYQGVVRKPVRIKTYVTLTEMDIKTLDLTRPVYFRQFGHHFGIVSLRTDNSSDLAEIEIIRL